MQGKNKYVRNLTIGTITGGLIAGGIQLALIDKKPFINDYIDTYRITTDTTIRTPEGLTRLKPSVQYLTSDKIKDINQLEVKSYTQAGDNYDVDLYGFTIGSLTDKEITTKQNQFENGNALLSISNYDNYDDYQVESRELPASYENILEEINIKTINYNSVIPVRESNKENLGDTALWIFGTALGSFYGYLLGGITYQSAKKKIKKQNNVTIWL